MSARPRLQVACNDSANGLFDYCAPQLGIFDAELECLSVRPPAFDELWRGPRYEKKPRAAIRLSGKIWPAEQTGQWVGNWCWNEYAIGDGTRTAGWWMVDFLTWLRGRGLYHCTLGTQPFSNWFNGQSENNPAEIHTMIYEQRFN